MIFAIGERVTSTLDHTLQGTVTGLAHRDDTLDVQFYMVQWDGQTEAHLTRRVMP